MAATDTVLTIEDLGLRAREGALVEGLGMTVSAGEMVGILGESGCGKTITALSIMGLLPGPAVARFSGRIVLNGVDLTGLDERAMERVRGNDVAMIFQEPMTSLNPIMTVGDQIGEVLDVHRGLRGRALRDEAMRLLCLVGLESGPEQLGRYPFQLSGGQRQRVMIAIALACEPSLLIADEPTTALDVTIQAQILDLLLAMRERYGMACLLVTHDLGVIAETCDRAIVMYAGRIVEEGPVGALFAAPKHRYTAALIDTVPAGNRPGAPLPVIPGTVPPPGRRPPGCAFVSRCPAPLAQCAGTPPPTVGEGAHVARCWNPAA